MSGRTIPTHVGPVLAVRGQEPPSKTRQNGTHMTDQQDVQPNLTDSHRSEDDEEYVSALAQTTEGTVRLVALGLKEGRHVRMGVSAQEFAKRIYGPAGVRLEPELRKAEARELTAAEDDGGMGLTQREAAAALGVSQYTINNDLNPGSRLDRNQSSKPESDDTEQVGDATSAGPDRNQSSESEPSGADDENSDEELLPGLYPGDITGDAEQDTWIAENDPEGLEEKAISDGLIEKELKPKDAHVANNSGDNEWYTPAAPRSAPAAL